MCWKKFHASLWSSSVGLVDPVTDQVALYPNHPIPILPWETNKDDFDFDFELKQWLYKGRLLIVDSHSHTL